MTQLTLYTNPMSRGRIARWMLEEIGQPYEVNLLSYGPDMNTPDYLALNPMGKVPTLVHDGRVITECAAICAYLADAFPQAGLLPEDRSSYYRWLFFAAGPMEQAILNKSFGFDVPEGREASAGYGTFDLTISTLEKAVSAAPYVAGDKFSAADVYVGSQVGWGLRFGTIPASAPLQSYWDRLADRPALKRADTLSEAEMPEQGTA